MDRALDYLMRAYSGVGLEEDEIRYQALRGYQLNAERYGSRRSNFDKYGKG